ncbi:hypothetical protein RJT34_18762 [Clitoria ternatea]|uniref:Uncharacterized protein n=1 Tax=Clitoria ternatea TaxID=43366 RepID=A0AAN9PEB1_CLITE
MGDASREGKGAGVERSSEKLGIVFVQLKNKLVAIDLAKHCLNNSPPPILAVDYRVDHEFPFCMSSFRLDDKFFLVGGGALLRGTLNLTPTVSTNSSLLLPTTMKEEKEKEKWSSQATLSYDLPPFSTAPNL